MRTFFIISLIVSISLSSFCQNLKKEREVIYDSLDHKRVDKPYENLYIQPSFGYEEREELNFKFYLKGQLINSFKCVHHAAIDRCILENGKYASFSLPHSNYREGDTLRVEINSDYIHVKLKKDYKKLSIASWGEKYKALYIRGWGDRTIILE